MSRNEDNVPAEYLYFWASECDLSLPDFLTKYKPSMVQNDGRKPWIWVQGAEPTQKDTGVQEAVDEASKLLKEVTDRVEGIKNDASIPMRSSKKTGAKSKKEVREQVQAEATEKLKEIATKHGYVSGKWLIFTSAEKVDMIWSNLSTSLVSGPLASTSAYLAKVATSPEQDNPSYQHLICVYVPDVYNKDEVAKVMKILLRNHGVSLSGVKSNLYTSLGIDSKHASGIPSTTWKNSALLSEKETKELRDAFFTDLASDKAAQPEKSKSIATDDAAPAATGKPKPKLKTKAADDPFASDDDKPDEEEEMLQTKTTKGKPQPKKVIDDAFASDEDDAAEEAMRKEKIKAKKAKAASSSRKRQLSGDNEDEEDEEEDRPKKRKSGRSGK